MPTIDLEPSGVKGVGECLQYGVSMASLGSGTITRKLGYRLKDADTGDYITAERAMTPRSAGFTEYLDFTRNVKGLVYTTPPLLQSWSLTAAESDDNFMKSVQLETKEYVVENDPSADPPVCNTTEEAGPTSASVQIVNSATQNYQIFVERIGMALSMRPETWNVPHTTYQWVWTYGPANIRLNAYNKENGLAQQIDISGANNVNIVPIGPFNSSIANVQNIRRVEVLNLNFSEGDARRNIGTYYVNMCDHCPENIQEIYFLSPLGGYDTITFDCPSVSVVKNYKEICRYDNCGGTQINRLQRGGKTIGDATAATQFTLTRTAANTPSQIEWFESFLASTSYYKRRTVNTFAPVDQAVKVLINGGTIGINEDTGELVMQVTGRYLDWSLQGSQL